jgi:peptidylprolyl isomerase
MGAMDSVTVDNATDLSSKPGIAVDTASAAPTQLVSEDLVTGDGPEIAPGVTASVQYVGVSWSTGREFDASWDRGQPFGFPVGAGRVIAGWDQGVVGMKVGGRRKLVIPPDLAYGQQGSPPNIGPNETLVFEIDLKKVGS